MQGFEKHIFVFENKREEDYPISCWANKGSHETFVLFK
jgi:hypothetical protein